MDRHLEWQISSRMEVFSEVMIPMPYGHRSHSMYYDLYNHMVITHNFWEDNYIVSCCVASPPIPLIEFQHPSLQVSPSARLSLVSRPLLSFFLSFRCRLPPFSAAVAASCKLQNCFHHYSRPNPIEVRGNRARGVTRIEGERTKAARKCGTCAYCGSRNSVLTGERARALGCTECNQEPRERKKVLS